MLYTLPVNKDEVNQLVEKASENTLASRQEVLIAIPQTIGTLQEVVAQLTHLYWVSDNTPELEGDRIARLELSIQQIQAEKEVSDRVTTIFGEDSKNACTWYHIGTVRKH